MKKRKLKKLVKRLRLELAELQAADVFVRPFKVGDTVRVKLTPRFSAEMSNSGHKMRLATGRA